MPESKSNMPLTGKTVLVTRASEQAQSLVRRLEEQGAQVITMPLIALSRPADLSELDHCLGRIADYDWLVFASVNAVKYTLERAAALNISLSDLQGEKAGCIKCAAVGPTTRKALEEAGLNVAFQPAQFVAEALSENFPGYPDLGGQQIFWPRTNIGRDVIVEKLRGAGATVDTAIAYISGPPEDAGAKAEALAAMLKGGKIDIITLASAQTARNLAMLLESGAKTAETTVDRLLRDVTIAAIGPQTALAARESLGKVDLEAADYSAEGLTAALLASLK